MKLHNCSQKKNNINVNINTNTDTDTEVGHYIPVHVVLASSSLFPQSFVPSQSHFLGMQRLLLHLNWSAGQL